MALPELSLIARFSCTSTLSAGAHTNFAPSSVTSPSLPQGLLNGSQVGEVRRAVCYSPINPVSGASDDLQYVQLVLDGIPYDYIWLSGRQDTSMAPPEDDVVQGTVIDFGKPFIDANGVVAGLLDATCPKFITSCVPMGWAGGTDVTHDFTIDLWGYIYDSVDLAARVPVYDQPDVEIVDRQNQNRTFKVVGRRVEAAGDWRGAWRALPAGLAQGEATSMPIHKLIRRNTNQNASSVNKGYVPQYANSSSSPAVLNPQDNMYFKLNARQAMLLERYGVNGPAAPNGTGYDLLSAWVQTGAETQQQHPLGGIPADYNRGRTRWGLTPGSTNRFAGVPKLPQGPQLLTGETAYLTWVDNGTQIPAGDVAQSMVATLIGTNAEGV